MKKSQDIIDSIVKKHSFSSLIKYRCYREFLELLPPRFKRVIAFVTVKNSQLLIAIKHPGYKMELNYSKEVIKSLLVEFVKQQGECGFMGEANYINIILAPASLPQEPKKEESRPYFKEPSKANFPVDIKDKDIKKRVLEIREIIKNGNLE